MACAACSTRRHDLCLSVHKHTKLQQWPGAAAPWQWKQDVACERRRTFEVRATTRVGHRTHTVDNGSERPQMIVRTNDIRQRAAAHAREAMQRWLWLTMGPIDFKIQNEIQSESK
jgi:hypothetical protein